MLKKVARMLPESARMLPESASHVIDQNCKERMAARQQLANCSAIIITLSILVGKNLSMLTDEVVSMKDQEEIRLNINGLLRSMKELEIFTSLDKKGSGAQHLPQTDHPFQSTTVLKKCRFSRYVKAKFEHSQLQRCYLVTSAMSRLSRRKISLKHKIMTTKDCELMKRDIDTFRHTFEQLENTTWKSTSNIPKRHSYGDDILELRKDRFLMVYVVHSVFR